jgi:adenylate cyclase
MSGGVFNYLTVVRTGGAVAQGALDGFFISLLLGSYTLFVARGYLSNVFRNLTFLSTLLINSGVYVFLTLFGRLVGGFLSAPRIGTLKATFFSGNFYEAMGLVFILSIAINFLIQMNRLVGQNVLANFLRGTYHKPREEERLFMFLDLESSTEIAERLGDKGFHALLNRFFCDLTDAVLQTDGEIHEYVGDEVIIVWKRGRGLRNGNCLRCFFLIERAIARHSDRYRQEFGLVPNFRASLHGGTVIAGELGDIRQKIAFVGDVLNSTARLLEHSRERNRRFLVSGQLLDQIHLPEDLAAEDLGVFQPRGKETFLRVYSVMERSRMTVSHAP